MKKKLAVAAAMSCVLMAGVITGCGNKEASAPTTTAAAVTTEAAATEAETTVAEPSAETATEAAETTAAEAKDEAAADAGDYTSWTSKEWSAAGDEEKLAVTKFYLIETTKATAEAMGQEYTSQMEAAYTDDVVKASIPTLDAAFAADANMTLQDLLDITTEAAAGMAEYATQQAQ